MADAPSKSEARTAANQDRMHATYSRGGRERHMAPHVVYEHATCPHLGCDQRMQAIDFRLEAHFHDPLVLAWWGDTGFAGRCPDCKRWIHFTIRAKRAIDDAEAATLPQLPENWHDQAIVL